MNLEKTVEHQYKDHILNLTRTELKIYIQKLAKEYYSFFFANDVLAYERTLNNLKLIESVGEGANIKEFINFSLLNEINSILNNNVESNVVLESFEIKLLDLGEIGLPNGATWINPPWESAENEKQWEKIANIEIKYNNNVYELKQKTDRLERNKEKLLKILHSKELTADELNIVNEVETEEKTNFDKYDTFYKDVLEFCKDDE